MSSLSSEVSQNTERSKANSEGVSAFEQTDTSKLQERIASLEAQINSLQSNADLLLQKIESTENSITIWSEKEFEKVWQAINNNPLGN